MYIYKDKAVRAISGKAHINTGSYYDQTLFILHVLFDRLKGPES